MNYRLFFLVLHVLLPACFTNAQTTPASIQINGESIKTVTFTDTSLIGMKRARVEVKGHDQKIHRYEGVMLSDVLSKAGIQLGETSKKATSQSYILVKAADNYNVIFALAEIDPLFTDKAIILADKEDEKALPPGVGHFQIIVPGEKKHTRWIRQIVSITLVTVQQQ